ncbi:hypothetical protein P175DRAFT_0194433 [Aspergillus ochraceoroseus IBT 24754]|uniref:Uncharacterized protein n=1 Tax=Aspergillus ochraceoroseus IBT 24754 TaxID=1392256 RepID=A0A2T5LZE3_9EURO|nr:uncharacterized protein P175DRAFT_0194433 [Aspergillus ochraceoroseus IBT 24754]PTU21657.1 hypothetical protein P175DRAFT_0194433 [Aspergillus ochraceoroseus IBT 24754]
MDYDPATLRSPGILPLTTVGKILGVYPGICVFGAILAGFLIGEEGAFSSGALDPCSLAALLPVECL